MSGYTRQSSADIVPTAVVRAAPVNAEYNKLRDAFKQDDTGATGHKHDGTSDEGSYVPLIADIDGNNKVQTDGSNNRVGVFVEVSSVPVEQVRFQDGVFLPVTDNDVDLGSSSVEFKDLYLDGTAKIDTLTVDENATITGNLTVSGTIDSITTVNDVEVGGNLTVNGTADFTNTPLSNVSDPTLAQQAATKNYVDTAINNLIGGAPGTLDTLDEIAAAINDDENVYTTLTTSIAAKLPLSGGTMTGDIALGGNKVTGSAAPSTGTDLTNKTYVDSILGSATDAATSATNAANSATAAAASFDSFDDRYLGAKASDPTLDNDGDALLTGAIYWNTTDNQLKIYDGAAWQLAAFDTSGALVASNNLSDVADTATAIQNLGITATAAELNTLDGVTATTAELNILDGVTATAAELNYNDITTLGTSEASKVVTSDANGVTSFADGVNEGYTAVTSTSNATTIDCRDGNVFAHTLTENTTFTFSNPPSSGTAYGFTLKLVQDSTARTVTWPASVDWAGATAPTISTGSGEVDVFVFFTHDGGTTWYGFTAGQVMS